MPEELNNEKVVTLALYKLNGLLEPVHTEEIAVKAYELAPTKFRWQLDKYKDRVNLDYVYSALSDARKEKNGSLVKGTIQKGWTITENGISFAKKYFAKHDDVKDTNKTRDPQAQKLLKWKEHQSLRLAKSDAYKKISQGKLKEITEQEVNIFFQIDDYLKPEAKVKRIQQFKTVFFEDPKYGSAIEKLSKVYEVEYASK